MKSLLIPVVLLIALLLGACKKESTQNEPAALFWSGTYTAQSTFTPHQVIITPNADNKTLNILFVNMESVTGDTLTGISDLAKITPTFPTTIDKYSAMIYDTISSRKYTIEIIGNNPENTSATLSIYSSPLGVELNSSLTVLLFQGDKN